MSILKLIAIVPPEPILSEVRKEQEYIAQQWGPSHALRTPPHITIIPPLSLTSAEVGLLYGMAYAIASQTEKFQIELKGYGSFRPRVVYIHPVVPPALEKLNAIWQQALRLKMPHVLEKYPERPYHPHMTLAHKDVKRDQFDLIWQHYERKKYYTSFPVDHFCILQHTGQGWEVEHRYFLDT
jgi:2'-5' RNA ligase